MCPSFVISVISNINDPMPGVMPEPEQIWFFVREHMDITAFSQRHCLKHEILGSDHALTLLQLLSRASPEGEQSPAPDSVDDFAFYIHSASMKACVQLLTDTSIYVTWSLYCQHDDVVTIYVRNAKDPSPNTSHAPSHNASLRDRRQVSGASRRTPAVLLRPELRHISTNIDVLTGEPVASLADDQRVVLDLGQGKVESFSKDYLLGMYICCLSGKYFPVMLTCRRLDQCGG